MVSIKCQKWLTYAVFATPTIVKATSEEVSKNSYFWWLQAWNLCAVMRLSLRRGDSQS